MSSTCMKGQTRNPSPRKDVEEVKHASVRLIAGVAGALALVVCLVAGRGATYRLVQT